LEELSCDASILKDGFEAFKKESRSDGENDNGGTLYDELLAPNESLLFIEVEISIFLVATLYGISPIPILL